MFAQGGYGMKTVPVRSLPVCPLSGGDLNRSTQRRCLLEPFCSAANQQLRNQALGKNYKLLPAPAGGAVC